MNLLWVVFMLAVAAFFVFLGYVIWQGDRDHLRPPKDHVGEPRTSAKEQP